MTSQQKPIVIVVHGSWHRPLHYASLLTSLRASGYTVRVPALPTTAPGGANVQKGMADDVDAIRSAMKAYLDAGSEIIVVCHSMGGIAGTDAVVGETVPERRDRGEAGGIRAVVYIASFAPPASGQNLPIMLGLTEQPDWWSPKDGLAVLEPKASGMLYSGIDDELAAMSMQATSPQSLRSFGDVCKHSAADIVVPKTYVATTQDLIVPYAGQLQLAQAAAAKVVELDCGHSPFLDPHGTTVLVEAIQSAADQGAN